MRTLPPRVAAFLDENPDEATQIIVRAIEEALTAAEPAYWRRRARTLSEVGTPWADGAALACSQHAVYLEAEARGLSILDVLQGA